MIHDTLEAERDRGEHSRESFCVNPSLSIVEVGGGSLLVKHGGRADFAFVIDDPTDDRLLARLVLDGRGPRSVERLVATGTLRTDERDRANDIVDELRRDRVLLHPDDSPLLAYATLLGRGNESKLSGQSDARPICVVVGDGLVAGELRRLLHDAGVECAGREADHGALRERGNGSTSTTEVVVIALDSYQPAVLAKANQRASKSGTPTLYVWVDGARGVVGPLMLSGLSPCYTEAELQLEAATERAVDAFIFKDPDGVANGSRGTATRLQASMCASWALHGLLAALVGRPASSPLVGHMDVIDFETGAVDQTPILRLPRCPACGESR